MSTKPAAAHTSGLKARAIADLDKVPGLKLSAQIAPFAGAIVELVVVRRDGALEGDLGGRLTHGDLGTVSLNYLT